MNTFAIGRLFARYAHAIDLMGFQLQRLAAHGHQNGAVRHATDLSKPFSVSLQPMEFWECEATPGQTFESRDGLMWITQTGDIGDHIVEAGGRWTAQLHGRVVVQAMTKATLHVEKP